MGYLSCNAESAISVCDPNYRKQKSVEIRRFRYADLLSATDDFSSNNFLGKGSHGSVYRAVLDNGKLTAAVKKTKANCNTPADNEIEILSRVYHPHLVNLIGYTSDNTLSNNNTKLLVVEYMPNGSLYDLLHSSSFKPPSWSRRVRFALQVAKAVQSLHSANPPVIHRDIKSSNVLIDRNWNARLGDFGLALRGHVEDVRVKCTPPAGTLGYLDPGYLAPSDVSVKSDVFSYGILLLEIISGRYAIDMNYSPPSVVDWAVPLIKRGDFAAICDGRIGAPVDKELIRRLAILAARCVRSTAEKRPGMTEVVECLKLLRKRHNVGPVWSNLRRRVKCVEKPLPKGQAFDGSEEAMRISTCASRRNSRKVSSVASLDHEESEASSVDRAVAVATSSRPKSIGSFAEFALMMKKVGPGTGTTDIGSNDVAFVRSKKNGVAVKMPMVKLSKSRSMGVLQTPRLTNHISKKYDFDISKLVISFDIDEKSEIKMLEKPLVLV